VKDRVRVAAIPIESKPGQTEANLARIHTGCERAAREGAELVVFPELSLTGFVPNHPVGDHNAWLREALRGARRMAEPLSGNAVRTLMEIARSHRLLVAAGLLEDDGNRLFNTTVLVNGGGLAGAWRKMHVPMFEMPFYNGGPEPGVAETPLGRIGVNICFDALFPESTRLLAVQNVEIVLFPFAADPSPGTAEAWMEWAAPPVRARCVENGVFGVACNYAGHVSFAGAAQTFPGGSLVAGPGGEIIAQDFSESGMLIADLDEATLTEARSGPEALFRFRRPEIYGRLAK
jgi:predicted amidohydrolase